jgi:DNA-binding CsgD family transcriptional regulator
MLQARFASILQAASRDDFRDEIVRFSRGLGFEIVSAMAVFDQLPGRSEFICVGNQPSGFGAVVDGTANERLDPVMQHCRRQSVPIIWDQKTYTSVGLGNLWEQQAQFGLCTGIAMAMHLPDGRHFVLGVERDQALPAQPAELMRMVADLQLFATCAQEAGLRVLSPDRGAGAPPPKLTPRELEALKWTMEGKTAWEVGAILGISERTAVLHVNNATHKLNCASKHQAVLKALRLGLIH